MKSRWLTFLHISPRHIVVALCCMFSLATQAQLTFKSMLDNINCASYGCIKTYMENQGFALQQTDMRGDNLTEYTYYSTQVVMIDDVAYPEFFIVAQRSDGVISYFMYQTPEKEQYKKMYDDMQDLHGYAFHFTQMGYDLYQSAITKKEAAIQKNYDANQNPIYTIILYNREDF